MTIDAVDPRDRLTRQQRVGITIAIATVATAALGFGYLAPVISQNLERMTASGALLGWLISIGAVTTILMTPIAPKLLSRIGAGKLLILAITIGSLTIPLFKLFWSVEMWFLLRFIQGCAFTLVFVASETWINQLAPEHKRGRILGLYGTALAGSFGLGSAFAIFTGIDGWLPFLFGAGLNLLGIIPLLFVRHANALAPPPSSHSGFSSVFKIVRAAPAILACGVIFGAIEQGIFHFVPVYGTRLGYTEHMARILLIFATIGNAIFQLPMGLLADKVDRQKLLLFLMLAAGLGPLLIIWASSNFILLSAALFVYVGLTTALYTVGLVLLAQRFKGHFMAAANAAFIFAYGVGALCIPPLAGYMMDIIRPNGLMMTLSGAGALGLLLIIARWKASKTPS